MIIDIILEISMIFTEKEGVSKRGILFFYSTYNFLQIN